MSDNPNAFDQFMKTVEERFACYETQISALQLENLHLREVFNHKMKQCEETIAKANDDVLKKMELLQGVVNVQHNNCVMVGHQMYGEIKIPIICNSETVTKFSDIVGEYWRSSGDYSVFIYLETLPLLHKLKTINMNGYNGLTINHNNKKLFTFRTELNPNCIKNEIKTLYNFCETNNIQFLWNGQETINNIPIQLFVEQNCQNFIKEEPQPHKKVVKLKKFGYL